ncbi:hypothetical protein B2G88_12175 [Natronolimnobius baerhuensis]|uniref:Uncharacterized protein n=1 Tax=Natronolimnobius baerhuensis TaxID=253108 RepID=A0A202E9Z9_9EURY|nr:hypothetical protein B2G88_12175 [Natronolimnobius baerhuensis]
MRFGPVHLNKVFDLSTISLCGVRNSFVSFVRMFPNFLFMMEPAPIQKINRVYKFPSCFGTAFEVLEVS